MTPDLEQLIAETYLNLKLLLAEVDELKAQVKGHPGIGEGWMRSAEAAIALRAEGILNDRHLRKLLKAGVFSTQKGEIRNVSTGNRPTWEYNIPKCRAALAKHFKAIR